MRSLDIIVALVIGEVIALFGLGILKNLGTEIRYLSGTQIEFFYWILPILFPLLSLGFLWVASLIGKKILVIWQFAKFALVGVLNTFIDLGVLNLLIWVFGIAAGLPYSMFKGISFIAATTNSYFWNKFWTFSSSAQGYGGQGKKVAPKEFAQFFTIAVVGFGINVGAASFIVNIIGPQFGLTERIWANVGAIIATLVGMTWNFLGYKFIVFKK